MPVIRIAALGDDLGAAKPTSAYFVATVFEAGSKRAVRVEGAEVTFPLQVTAEISATGVTEISLEDLPEEYWWHLSAGVIDGKRDLSVIRDVVFPEGAGPFDFKVLVDIDPDTREPITKAPTVAQTIVTAVAGEATLREQGDSDLAQQIAEIELTPGPQGPQGNTGAQGAPGSDATVTSSAVAGVIAAPGTARTAVDARADSRIETQKGAVSGVGSLDSSGKQPESQVPVRLSEASISTAIATTLAAAPTVTAAAVSAVGTALAGANYSFTLVEGPHAEPVNLTVARGTPNYTNTGKFGNAVSGAVLRYTVLPLRTGDYTVEGWVKRSAVPSAAAVLFYGVRSYVGLTTGGLVFYGDPSVSGGVNICDGAWHHVAYVVSLLVDGFGVPSACLVQGVWVDGVRVIGPRSPVTTPTMDAFLYIGGFTSATSADNFAAQFDEVRVSFSPNDYTTQKGTTARYVGTPVTPPSAESTWDGSTLILAHLSSASALVLDETGYPPRPTSAPGGAVTYVGTTEPTDMLTRDFWVQA